MSIQNIALGTTPNDGTGDTLRSAGQKINSNFSQVVLKANLAVNVADYGMSPAASSTANVTALRDAMDALDARGGGILVCGAGLFMFDATELGAVGVVIPDSVTISGVRGATIWASTNPASGNLLSASSGVVQIEGVELRGKCSFSGLTGGGMRGCTVRGTLSSDVQYAEVAVNWVAAFAAPTYHDDDGAAPAADYTSGISGNILSMTLSSDTALIGVTRYARYAQCNSVTLDPTAYYIVRFDDGFMSGVGATAPIIQCYDASGNPLDQKQKNFPYTGAAVANVYVPNETGQFVGTGAGGTNEPGNWQTCYIFGASSLKISLGAYRPYGAAPGQTATWDVSKIRIYKMVNDFAGYSRTALAAITQGVQVHYQDCTDIVVEDCDFLRIAGRALLADGCTNTLIQRNRVRFCCQGLYADAGLSDTIQHNYIDMRMRTTGGALIPNIGYRWKGIGGDNSDRITVRGNYVVGASWAIEILLRSSARRGALIGNRVEQCLCAASIPNGDWDALDNIIHPMNDAVIGLELVGEAAYPFVGRAIGNVIRWSDFSGYYGVAYSVNNHGDVVIEGGYVRAPVAVANVESEVDTSTARLTITGVDADIGCTALKYRSRASVVADFGVIRHYKVCYPDGSASGNSVLDISALSEHSNPVHVTAHRVDLGSTQMATVAKVQNISLNMGQVVGSAAWRTASPIQIFAATGAMKIRLNNNRFVDMNTSISESAWARLTGTMAAGSTILQRGNSWAGVALPQPTGTITASQIVGDMRMTAYLTGQVIPTLAAGASVDFTGLSMSGVRVANSTFAVTSYTAGGLSGYAVEAWATADDTCALRLTNISGASKSGSTQNLVLRADRRDY